MPNRRKTLISVLAALSIASMAHAEITTQITGPANFSELVDIIFSGEGAPIYANSTSPADNKIILTGQTISVSNTFEGSGKETVAGIWARGKDSIFNIGTTGSTISVVASGSNIGTLAGVKLNTNPEVTLGGDKAKVSVVLNGSKDVGLLLGLSAIGSGSRLTVSGDSLAVTLNGGEIGYGIHVANNTNDATTGFATVNIDSKNTVVKGVGGDFCGLVAMSQGRLFVNGNLEIDSPTAIVARGDAWVHINESKTNTVRIKGDIDFNYDQKTSRTKVDADVLVNLSNPDSYWKGSTTVSYGSGAPEQSLTHVTGMKLNLSNGGTWIPTIIEESHGDIVGVSAIPVVSLGLDGGVINIEYGSQQSVKVESLSGRGGTINIRTALDDEGVDAGSFEVINPVTSGARLAVNFTGITSDEIIGNPVALAELSKMVKAAGATQTQTIAEGNVVGALVLNVTPDGTVLPPVEKVNSVTKALSDVNSLSFMAFRTAMNDVNARMGDLRTTPKTAGAWTRYYGGQMKYGSQGFKERYNTIQIGADGWIDNFYLGAAFSYTDANGTLKNGSSEDKTYSLGIYGGWFGEDGQFVDVIVKRSRMKNEFDIFNTSGTRNTGSYHNWGTSLSVEYGRRFNFTNKGFFVEPQAELLIGRVNSKSYRTSSGVNVKQDAIDSVVGRVGLAVGYAFPKKKGNVYAKASVLHDWKSKAKTTVGNDRDTRSFIEDLSGTWGEFVIGFAYNATNRLQGYGEVKTTAGSPIHNPWQVNFGIRYSF